MRITQDVCEYAASYGIADETEALRAGMVEMSRNSREGESEVYRSEPRGAVPD